MAAAAAAEAEENGSQLGKCLVLLKDDRRKDGSLEP